MSDRLWALGLRLERWVSRQALIASRMLAGSSSMISPWLAQPGKAGTSA